ncbi:lipase maturation factor 2-like [Zootermopsis nevadensis]|uniref:Lipase maturation factor n=1 Tax=Zootermopsis nevadensis TaxID=136037 RepID=A0A067QNW9_ZOONE|nr:lipase maturation factor 2-like [Zootermopsis nevadensis]KDR11021.1 Lipase maturation factor 2 [Zootermopsis nevadensis]
MVQIRYTRNLFLRGMSVVYLFAFTSFYIQIPGLYGNNGVLPARTQLDSKAKTLSARIHTKPTLLWLAPYIGLDTEYMMDVLALLGIFLAFTGFVSQKFCTAPSFAGLWSLYYSLYQVGQTFMWFQWDVLLLEAGFLSILVAPLRYQSHLRRRAATAAPSDSISFWLVRWLLFRLMFQSGVVKLLSYCPTWWGLTALSIHFESQCIPTPLAWYAHHLPRWLLKLSTAFTFVVEIGLPHLFFFPVRSVRIVAFFLQVLLQIAIILTGNYNFFNILTIVLCISLLDDDVFYRRRLQKGKQDVWWSGLVSKLVNVAVYGGVLYATYILFSVRISSSWAIESDVAFTKQELDWVLSRVVPGSVYLGFVSLSLIVAEALTVSILEIPGIFSKIQTILTTLFYTGVAAFVFGISLVPYSSLHPAGNSTVIPVLHHWHSRLDHLHLANSYGLFRRMTGVGGRPEVILEGSNHIDGPWLEYNFLYKPGNVNSTPSFVAPHQPRLDWQMWFAALGTYHQNPWIMSLTYRLLQGQPEVLQLIDTSRNPFPAKPPKYIKASLYHYHYSAWSQRWSGPWWTREKVGEYLPIFSRDHPPLLDYLRNIKILTGASQEGTDSGSHVAPWLKALLDRLRYLVSLVEPSILLWSIFSAGCAIITTSSTTGSTVTRR